MAKVTAVWTQQTCAHCGAEHQTLDWDADRRWVALMSPVVLGWLGWRLTAGRLLCPDCGSDPRSATLAALRGMPRRRENTTILWRLRLRLGNWLGRPR